MSVNTKNRRMLVLLLIILIVFIIYITILFINSDNKIELTQIAQYNYFIMYENEKYGVIDKTRKCNYNSSI